MNLRNDYNSFININYNHLNIIIILDLFIWISIIIKMNLRNLILYLWNSHFLIFINRLFI